MPSSPADTDPLAPPALGWFADVAVDVVKDFIGKVLTKVLAKEGIPVEPGLAAEMRSWSTRLGVASPL